MPQASIAGLRASIRRSEERFSRNAETDVVWRLLLEKNKMAAVFILFQSSHGYAPVLHSFPTRRSSDLYISPLSNSTPCIRKDRISSKSLMRLSICLWKPSIGD